MTDISDPATAMPMRHLGATDTRVSQICLGSMTWGSQNTPREAFAQIDYALDHGINFIDTAEMYPTTPLSPATQGDTERIIGDWCRRSGRRDDVLIATKVTGKGNDWIQEGRPIDPVKISRSIEQSLKRLNTERIDLYQLHWPNRGSYHFRKSWTYDPSDQPERRRIRDDIRAILDQLGRLVDAGKVRHIGLSNETCWGVSQFLDIAAAEGFPRVVSIQNEYSLMHRLFDLDLAELAHHENVGLLAFSPLAAGMLSGKYESGELPEGSRRTLNDTLSGRYTPYSRAALARYVAVARERGLDPAQMAIAFCLGRPFMTSVIIGATSMLQLETNIAAAKLALSDDVRAAIAGIHRDYPIPM